MQRIIHSLILCLLFSSAIRAVQKYFPTIANPILEPWRWQQVSTLNGKGIRCFAEGPPGTMWFGVDQGIMSYDGRVWKTIPLKDSSTVLPVTSIFVSSAGNLYAAVQSGLFWLHQNRWQRLFPLNKKLPILINSFIELPDGSILAGLGARHAENMAAGLLHFSENHFTVYASQYTVDSLAKFIEPSARLIAVPEKLTILNEQKKPIFNVLDVFMDKQGAIYAAISSYLTAGFVSQWKFNAGQPTPLQFVTCFSEKDGLRIRDYVYFAQSTDHKIWIISNAHEKGINIYDGKRWNSYRLSRRFGGNDSQNCILACSDGTVWIDGHGKIFVHKNNEWTLYRSPEIPLPTSSRIIFYEASDGIIWIAGRENEVFRFDGTNKYWSTYKDLNFQCEAGDKKLWFISADGKAVCQHESTWVAYGIEDGLIDAPVRLITTSYGEIWAAGSDHRVAATAYFDGLRWFTQKHPTLSWGIDYRAVFEAKDGSLWFGCGVDFQSKYGQVGGIIRYPTPARRKHRIIHYSEKNGFPIGMAYGIGQSKDGRLWLGGRVVWTFDGKSWSPQTDFDFMREYVDVVNSNKTGQVWFGFRNYGLFQFDGLNWRHFTVDEGLVSNGIISICAENDSSVWVATEKDICRFDGRTFSSPVLPAALTMDREGGDLQVTSDGKIWVNKSAREWKRRASNKNGAAQDSYYDFRTVRYVPDSEAPETEITVYSEKVSYKENTSIFWLGTDVREFTRQNNLYYSFRLNNDNWSPFQPITHQTLFNLSPGFYRFEVRARDLDFNIDPTPAKITFEVLPPLWRQAWFIFSAILISSLVTFLEVRVLRRDVKLKKLNDQLSERTIELEKQKNKVERQRDNLKKMVKKVQELSQLRLRFFTNISHEFRTPLTLILGPIDHLLSTGTKKRTKDQINLYRIIQKNAYRLLRLINQILDVYRIDEGRLSFNAEQGDLVHYVHEIFSLFANLAQQRKINYKFYSTQERIEAQFDYDKIEKIMFNLLSNSFKNTPACGSISVHVALLASNDGNPNNQNGLEKIQIEVKDTGRGIAEKNISQIFDRFYQIKDPADGQPAMGNGIGLSYIKDLIDLHKGSISVQSNPGIETNFTIRLPRFYQDDREKNAAIAPRSSNLVISADLQAAYQELEKSLAAPAEGTDSYSKTNNTKRHHKSLAKPPLLIVDDESDVRDYLKNCLSEHYIIYEAGDGQDGIKQALLHSPELIISDVLMPHMDGIEFCKTIKTNFNTSHIPVILLTARTSDENKMEGLAIGADDYVEKPFNSHLLAIRIKNLIQSRQQLKKRFLQELKVHPGEIALTSVDEHFLQQAISIVEKYLDDPGLNAKILGKELNISRAQLYRKIAGLTGQSVNYFIKTIRLKHAARLIVEKKLTISEAAYEVGFSAPTNFATDFRKHFGMTPSAYIQKQIGQP